MGASNIASVSEIKNTASIIDVNLFRPIYTDIEDTSTPLVNSFGITGNYPNPFNPTTTIKFNIDRAGSVKFDVFNILGQKVESLTNKKMAVGQHELTWDANAFPSGIYFVRIVSASRSDVKRIMLLK